eukprot:m.78720 g.78720  ORF g.78720 m.78720 type:complete len:759 (-) comp25145_c0_seq1:46-2322(-)
MCGTINGIVIGKFAMVRAIFASAFMALALVDAEADLSPYELAMVGVMSNTNARKNLQMFTSIPHLAGTEGAEQVAKMYFDELSDALSDITSAEVKYDNHTALLSFPGVGDYLNVDGEFAVLEEEYYPEDNTSDTEWRSKIWNGYGAAGEVIEKQAVYVNYGRPEDFEVIDRMNISVTDRVVVVRYGGCFRGIKAREAENRGAAAVLIYSDPEQYGGENYGNSSSNETYPQGKYLPWSGAQRGSVLNLPLCPGNPSNRTDKCGYSSDTLLPNIPVMPISAASGLLLISNLGGASGPVDWTGGLPNTTYTIGPGHSVSLKVNNIRRNEKLINIIATIPGSLTSAEDNPVLLGNHRDAWVFGAADPNSGSVALIEVARGLNEAWGRGWRPLRTIIIGSWDGEEFGIIGSTSFAEANERSLINASVYINVDTAVSGPIFGASATPACIDSIVTAALDLNNRRDPNIPPIIISEADIGALGGGSDYAPFLNHLGIASIDVGFGFEGSGYPVYHSIYDSFHWMQSYGDIDFQHHISIARLWGLLAMRMSTDTILPMNVVKLSDRLALYYKTAEEAYLKSNINTDIGLAALQSHIADFAEVTQAFGKVNTLQIENAHSYNYILSENEKSFLFEDGLPNRLWYKNVLMASGIDKGYGADTFPGLMQAIRQDDTKLAQEQVKIIADCVLISIDLLKSIPGGLPMGADDSELVVILGLAIGLPLLVLGTIALSHQLSSETSGLLRLLSRSRGYGPISTTTEDGTSTDV